MASAGGTDDRVAAAILGCPRARFLPPAQRGHAHEDHPIAIGYGQTNSQPTTVRAMLSLLDVRDGQHVLDVGCGSAWTTALLADLVGPGGDVVGVEILPELVEWGRENLRRHDTGGRDVARIEQAVDGVLGWPAAAPYDRILVSAEAAEVPEALVRQLVTDGLMVVPVSGRMLTVRRSSADSAPDLAEHGYYRFVPLVRSAPHRRR